MNFRNPILSIAILAVSAGSCFAAPMEMVLDRVPESRLRENVRRALELFQTREGQADGDFLKRLEKREIAYRRDPNKAVGQKGIEAIRGIRTWMKEGGVLPPSDELLPEIIAYATEVAQAREKMVKPTTALATSLRRQKLEPLADAVESARLELGKILQTDETFKEGSVWLGFRQYSPGTVKNRIKFRIDTMADKQFVGRVDKNPQWGNHPVFELIGTVDGAVLRAKTGKKVNLSGGEEGSWSYAGYIIGRTVIGQFTGRNSKGKPSGGFFRVDLRD